MRTKWLCAIALALCNSLTVFSQLEETHEFGETGTYWYVYSTGKTWEFTAVNTMVVDQIEVKSVLASEGGTFHIEVRIKEQLLASWDQYVNETTFEPYFQTQQASFSMNTGDVISYKIYGGTAWDPVGGILGINHVRLMGSGTALDLEFTSLQDMKEARYGFGYAHDGYNLYAATGGTGESPYLSTTLERYNITSGNWTLFVEDLIPRRWCSAEYLPAQNSICIFNGEPYSDEIEVIDIQTGGKTYLYSNPYPVEYAGSAAWDEKIYVFGGSNADGFSKRMYEFDPVADAWTRLPDMPEAKQTNGIVINGILYVIGGYNGQTSTRIDAFDIQNASWTNSIEMPVAISAHSVCCSGDLIWIAGSYNNINLLAVFNTITNEFSQLSSNMIGRRHCGAFISGNLLYVYGGNQASSSGTVLNSLQCADISSYLSSVDEVNQSEYLISSIHPNPFSFKTTLSYTLKDPSIVDIFIYDGAGKRIDQIRPGKMYDKDQVIINLDGQPAGIYYYMLKTDDQIGWGKMIKIRKD